ncbi:hydrolytic enzyme protein [Rutstroemia sp. NJR-2017a WRK4]|nr:hydrolytic enzyme protein [Rutstroemia sp. NJR-2017a WRK4]
MRTSSILLFASTASIVHASVSCLKVGATAKASWTNSAGKSCTWSGAVGSNFGTNAVNGGDCNGRCGAGCTGAALGNYYTQDCFNHDICSWFNNASGGASDANCGSAYTAAEDDYLLGGVDGCSQTNPSLGASAPGKAVCV